MYALTPALRDLWCDLFIWVAEVSGVPLDVVEHAAPAPLDDLWCRDDLGLAFACGYPFAKGTFPLQPVAAPLPAGRRYGGQPVYATDLVVRADGPIQRLEETFGGRIGWTVEHSQSGFHAVRTWLAGERMPRYRDAVGPLVTPRRVIDAVLNGSVDVGPLDSYVHDLLRVHDPASVAGLRTVATTPLTPMTLLVAAQSASDEIVERLRDTLLRAEASPAIAPTLQALQLSGFAPVDKQAYRSLVTRAEAATAAGYATLT
jgi:ABC-type phosphate/phosphonate transport system substrate-binding protein